MAARKQTAPGTEPMLPLSLETLAQAPLTGVSLKKLRTVDSRLGLKKDRKVSGRISGALLAAVKHRLGVQSDTEAIELALVNMAIADDYGAWLVAQAGQLDEEFDLGV